MPKKTFFKMTLYTISDDRNEKNISALIAASCVACAGPNALKIVWFVYGLKAPIWTTCKKFESTWQAPQCRHSGSNLTFTESLTGTISARSSMMIIQR